MRKRRKRMDKLKQLVVKGLVYLSDICLKYARRLAIVEMCNVEYKVPPVPHSFTTFKEGMGSKNYCTRHDAAAKLVGWYLHYNGTPFVEDLIRAAEILLEDTSATSTEVSYLVGAWKDQASAINDKDREEAEEREDRIYVDLQYKTQESLNNKKQGDK
jgi:hypothetical protein